MQTAEEVGHRQDMDTVVEHFSRSRVDPEHAGQTTRRSR
jgi:hypothetical protein